MNKRQTALSALLVASMFAGPAFAGKACKTRDIAGKWIFATGIGQLLPPDTGITALGTMNITRGGEVSGKFDATIAGFEFIPEVLYEGTVTVNPDCTGTLTFITSAPSERTDSIAIVNRRQMLGMSQDPTNPWTYQVLRLTGGAVGDRDDD